MRQSSFRCCPIGNIPEGFTRLTDLCYAGYMRYNDIETPGGLYRDWRIVADEHPAATKSGRATGSCATGHAKFTMKIHELEHDHPDWDRTRILITAIDSPKTSMSWQEYNNALARKGVRGYEILRPKNAKSSVDIDL